MAATVVITDLGNSVQFTLANGNEFVLNKINMQIKQAKDAIYITDANGFVDSALNKVIKLTVDTVGDTIGGDPTYTDLGDLFDAINGVISSISLGGGGGAGGGNNTWSVAQGDLVATPTVGTTNITVTGLSWTFSAENVIEGVVKKVDASGDVSTLKTTNVSVSGGVITLGDEDVFATGDVISLTLVGPDKAYNEGTDAAISEVSNPDSAKWTSPEHLIDLAVDAETNRFVIPMEGYKDLSTHRKITAGGTVVITLWGTNNADAVVDFMLTSGFLFYGYGFELSVSGEAYDTSMERGSHECK